MRNLIEALKNFSKIKVLIVGDVMLDRYQWGTVSRISPEAPVPVVKLEKTSVAAGGAANVAVNIVGLGAETFLFGIVGDDEDKKVLDKVLSDSKINPSYLFQRKKHPTTVKTRVVAHNQHVVRIDQENSSPISDQEENLIFQKIENVFDKADVVIISDYAKGLLTENLLMRLITLGDKNKKKILVDPKGKDYTKYKGATLLTPNQKEARDACGLDDNDNSFERAGKLLLKKCSTEAILITQGEKGMTLFQNEDKQNSFKAMARKVYDVTGAGDTVIATLAVGIGAGLNFYEAAKIANIAAGLVVEQIGTTAISIEMLEKALLDVIEKTKE